MVILCWWRQRAIRLKKLQFEIYVAHFTTCVPACVCLLVCVCVFGGSVATAPNRREKKKIWAKIVVRATANTNFIRRSTAMTFNGGIKRHQKQSLLSLGVHVPLRMLKLEYFCIYKKQRNGFVGAMKMVWHVVSVRRTIHSYSLFASIVLRNITSPETIDSGMVIDKVHQCFSVVGGHLLHVLCNAAVAVAATATVAAANNNNHDFYRRWMLIRDTDGLRVCSSSMFWV